MKNRFSFFVLLIHCLFIANISFSQKMADFRKDFEKASGSGFDSSQVNRILENYFPLLTPFSRVNQLAMGIKGEKYLAFPLENMRDTPLYQNNIKALSESTIPNNRLLAYLMISSSGDMARRDLLAERLTNELNPGCAIWLGMGLMHMGFDKTSVLFKWVVKNNGEAGNFLFPMFMSSPADSLRATAYQFASSEDWNERIYAVQMLMKTGYTVQTDTILRNAIKSWPLHLKGYAIVPAQSNQIGGLLPILKPLLDSALTRKTALTALADSPTYDDRFFVVSLTQKNKPDRDVLESLKSSRYPDMVKHWLVMLGKDKVPEGYFFSTYQDSLLHRDSMLPFVQESLEKMKSPKVKSELVPVLRGRTDLRSVNLLFAYLKHENRSLRYYATEALKGYCSETLKSLLSEIVKDTNLATTYTFDLAIGCKMDFLQPEAELNYRSAREHMASINALNYLATYPQRKQLPLFRNLMTEKAEYNTSAVRIAAKGLAALNDTTSIDTIIKASDLERENADSNCRMYLEALGKLKGSKSKSYITSFLNSDDQRIKSFAEELLRSW